MTSAAGAGLGCHGNATRDEEAVSTAKAARLWREAGRYRPIAAPRHLVYYPGNKVIHSEATVFYDSYKCFRHLHTNFTNMSISSKKKTLLLTMKNHF